MKLYAFRPISYDYAFYVMCDSLDEAIEKVIVEAHKPRDFFKFPLDETITRTKLLDKEYYTVDEVDAGVVISQEVC